MSAYISTYLILAIEERFSIPRIVVKEREATFVACNVKIAADGRRTRRIIAFPSWIGARLPAKSRLETFETNRREGNVLAGSAIKLPVNLGVVRCVIKRFLAAEATMITLQRSLLETTVRAQEHQPGNN